MLTRVGLAVGAVASVPAWQLTKVHAASEQPASTKPEAKKKIRPSELPIYGEPEPPEFEYIPEWETPFHQKVSEARQWTWSYLDSIQDTTDKLKDKYGIAKAHTTDLLTYIQEDVGAVPRAAIITVSGLGGIVAGYKGGIMRKSLLAATAMTAAAAVCYPHEAVDISKAGWRITSDFAKDTYNDWTSSGTKKSSSVKSDKAQTKDTSTSSDKQQASGKEGDKTKPKMDFGMSKPEDKDMYTTRGS